MSPEQASGQSLDHRADVYALGVIMYEMFTGRVPFEADTYMGVLTQHMFVQPVPPSQVSEAARELGALEEITLICLEKRPEDRFESMNDLVEAIDRVVRLRDDGSVEVASRADSPTRPGPRSAPFRIADELEPPTFEELRAATDDALPPRPRAPWAWISLAAAALIVGVVGARLLRSPPPQATRATVVATPAASPPAASLAPPPAAAPPAPAPSPSATPPNEEGAALRHPTPRRPPPATPVPAPRRSTTSATVCRGATSGGLRSQRLTPRTWPFHALRSSPWPSRNCSSSTRIREACACSRSASRRRAIA